MYFKNSSCKKLVRIPGFLFPMGLSSTLTTGTMSIPELVIKTSSELIISSDINNSLLTGILWFIAISITTLRVIPSSTLLLRDGVLRIPSFTINKVKNVGMEIYDISTDEGDLEDVFIDLTKS